MMDDDDYDDDDRSSSDYSLDVPTDEEAEDVRHYQNFEVQPAQRLTPPSILLLPIMTPTMTPIPLTPPPRSPRARRFTSLPLHLEGGYRGMAAAAASPSAHNDSSYSTSFGTPSRELSLHSPRPPARRACCSRVLLVLIAYVGLMISPRPPILRYGSLASHDVAIPVPHLETELLVSAPSKRTMPQQQQQQQHDPQPQLLLLPPERESSPKVAEQPQQPKRRLRQPKLAHARTNRRPTIVYGGKPNASLLFLDHMEKTPLQKRALPRFFFSTGTSSAKHDRNSGLDDQQQQQQQHNWIWWILYKVAWLVLLGCTLEAGVREIPRRFQTWTGLSFTNTASQHHNRTSHTVFRQRLPSWTTTTTTVSSPPPPLARAFSTPRRRRGL